MSERDMTSFGLVPRRRRPLTSTRTKRARGANDVSEILLIPGPVAVAEDVLAAAAVPMQNHRGPRARALYERLYERLREILQTRQKFEPAGLRWPHWLQNTPERLGGFIPLAKREAPLDVESWHRGQDARAGRRPARPCQAATSGAPWMARSEQ